MADEDPGTRWRLQPRAVAPPRLGRGHRADAACQHLVRQPRHLLVELARARQGRCEFEWLDTIMDKLHAGGIAVDLATATATPPRGSRRPPRSCPSTSTATRCGRAAGRPGAPPPRLPRLRPGPHPAEWRRYHEHPGLAMWHVSNEYACHNLPCYCDECARHFRAWLRRRYDSLEALNDAWGTAFWSQRYTDWEQILPRAGRRPSTTRPTCSTTSASAPTRCSTTCGPSGPCSTSSPGVPVDDDFMTLEHFRHLDYTQWTPTVDVVSTDHYIVDSLEHPRAELAFSGDLTRGLAGGARGCSGALHQRGQLAADQPPSPRPDDPRRPRPRRGADTIAWFQWRQSRAGSEKFHSAVVPHAGARQRPLPRGRGAAASPTDSASSSAAGWSASRSCMTTRRSGPPRAACRGSELDALEGSRDPPPAPRPRGHGRRHPPGADLGAAVVVVPSSTSSTTRTPPPWPRRPRPGPGRRDLLLGHQRRARPRASSAATRRVPRPARVRSRSSSRSAPTTPCRSSTAPARVWSEASPPSGHRGRCRRGRRAPRRPARGHATRRR